MFESVIISQPAENKAIPTLPYRISFLPLSQQGFTYTPCPKLPFRFDCVFLTKVSTDSREVEEVLVFEGSRKELVIGRKQGCEVVISKPNVSRQHCCLHIQSNQLSIEDRKSSTGTFLRVVNETLQEMDTFEMGSGELTIERLFPSLQFSFQKEQYCPMGDSIMIGSHKDCDLAIPTLPSLFCQFFKNEKGWQVRSLNRSPLWKSIKPMKRYSLTASNNEFKVYPYRFRVDRPVLKRYNDLTYRIFCRGCKQ